MIENNQNLSLALSGLAELPVYPLNLIKTLMQISHEPLPPFPSKTIFGKEKLFYPNSFVYIKHVYNVDGFFGLYRGFGIKALSTSVSNLVANKLAKFIDENEVVGVVDDSDEKSLAVFKRKLSRDVRIKCWAIVISHPLHVMAMRCMAQFVGGESSYSSWNIFQNALEIYRGEGISGFFNGLIPRMLFEVSTVAIASGVAYTLKTYILDDDKFRNDKVVEMGSGLFANSITYPLAVVCTVSCISGANLVAGKPPKMPVYNSWVGVFKHLYETNGLKKGNSHFFRVFVPTVQYNALSIY